MTYCRRRADMAFPDMCRWKDRPCVSMPLFDYTLRWFVRCHVWPVYRTQCDVINNYCDRITTLFKIPNPPSPNLNPFTPTVAIWVGYIYKASCARLGCRHLYFLTSGHSGAQPWPSECPDVKNYKWRLNLVWHRMLLLYSCTHMATLSAKWLRYSVVW